MNYLVKKEMKRSLRSPLSLFILVVYFFYMYKMRTNVSFIETTGIATGVWILVMATNGFLTIYRDGGEMRDVITTSVNGVTVFFAKFLSQLAICTFATLFFIIYNTVAFFGFPQLDTNILWLLKESYLYIVLYYYL